MPDIVDDGPKLAEIFRNLLDFRSEFRDAVNTMMRKDLHERDMRFMEARNIALEADIKRLGLEIEADRTERKMLRNTMLGSVLAAVASLVIALVK